MSTMSWPVWNETQKSQTLSYMMHCRGKRKQMYQEYLKSCTVCTTTPCDPHNHYVNLLDDLVNKVVYPTPIVLTMDEDEDEQEQEEDTMYTHQDVARDHLNSRLYDIQNEHEAKLQDHFNLSRKTPKTVGEFRDWMKKGYYTLGDEEKDSNTYYGFSSHFRWGTEKPDHDGYEKAHDKLRKARRDAEDIVTVKTDEDARLQALRDFESATFH